MTSASNHKHHVTAKKDKVSLGNKVLYGSGSFADMTFQWTLIAFALPIFNQELGFSPVIIGLVLGITRIWDGVTDPVMGSISDNARTRWGRRRPFIGAGAVLCSIFFIIIWLVPEGISDWQFFFYFLITSILFYTSFTVFSVPLYALGYEMSADYHERTKMMGVRIFANSFNGIILFPWFLWFIKRPIWDGDTTMGIRMVGLGIGLLMMILALIPALTLREKKRTHIEKQKRVSVLKSLKFTFVCKPYVYLIIAFFAILFSYNTIATAYSYPLRYFVCGGDENIFSLWFGRIEGFHHVATLLALWPISLLSRRFGKRIISLMGPVFMILGALANLICYVPEMPWLIFIPRGLSAIGLTCIFVLVPSMIADVVDYDEQRTGTRREGMFGAVHFWVIKIALALGLLATGILVESTGFNVDLDVNQPEGTINKIILMLGIIPTIGAAVSIYFIPRYSLTEKKMYEIRAELEKRRGVS